VPTIVRRPARARRHRDRQGRRGASCRNEGLALFAAAERAGEAFAERGAVFARSARGAGSPPLPRGRRRGHLGGALSIDPTTVPRRTRPAGSTTTPDLVDPADGRLDTLPHWRRPSPSPTSSATWSRGRLLVGGGVRVDHSPRLLLHRRRPRARRPGPTTTGGRPRGRRRWLAIPRRLSDPADGGAPYELWRHASTRAVGRGRRLRQLARPAPTLRADALVGVESRGIRALEAQKCVPMLEFLLRTRFSKGTA